MKENNKKEVLRALKYTLFAASAGIIELVAEILLGPKVLKLHPALAYTIALVLSVIWNFTFNRKFTFKSSNNVGKAMFLVFLYYVVFTPLSAVGIAWMTNGNIYGLASVAHLGWDDTIATIIWMIINFVTEYAFQRLVVYGKDVDQK